ncbi:MAG: glycosyltransferase family 4 protein [Undibacterium sp.]
MKVLFLNYEYPPLGGGAANATACILEEWAHDGSLEVHLVTSSISADLNETALGSNVFIHRLPIGKNENNLHHQSIKDVLVYSLKAWWFSRQLIKKQSVPFDMTLAFFGVPCGFLALLLKWEFHIPYAVSLRGSDVPGYSRKYAWLYPFIRPIIRLVWRSASAVVPNSVGLEMLAKESAPNQSFTIIENGVDIRRFTPDQAKRSKREFIITPGASRVTERKGLNYLIEAIAMLVPKYTEIRLKVMGDGSARPALEALVREKGLEENVNFLGRIPREETAPYYQEASLFVLPSLNEGMSNAMLEALASGLPIIATPTGGTVELVTEGMNGMVVPEKSAEALAKAIETFLQNRELVTSYGNESRKRAEAQSWQRTANDFQKLLIDCVRKAE